MAILQYAIGLNEQESINTLVIGCLIGVVFGAGVTLPILIQTEYANHIETGIYFLLLSMAF